VQYIWTLSRQEPGSSVLEAGGGAWDGEEGLAGAWELRKAEGGTMRRTERKGLRCSATAQLQDKTHGSQSIV